MFEIEPSKFLPGLLSPEIKETERLAVRLPYVSAVDDKTLLLRDGDIMASFTVEGLNADTADMLATVELNQALSRFIAQQRANVAFYVHRASFLTKPHTNHASTNEFSQILDDKWQHHLRNCGLRERHTVVTLIMRPPALANRIFSKIAKHHGTSREEVTARARTLDRLVETLMIAIGSAKPRRLTISEGKWLGLLKSLIDGVMVPVVPGVRFCPIADLLVSSNVTFKGNYFQTECAIKEQNRYGAIFSLKDYPNSTYPGVLDRLNLSYDIIVTQSFTPIDNLAAQSKISLVRKRMRAAEDAAISLLAELEHAEDDVASGRLLFGDHHLTVAVYTTTKKELDAAVSDVLRAIQDSSAVAVRESFSARAAYFAQHPGNFKCRTRPAMISSVNFANLNAMHTAPKGFKGDKCPWGDSLATFPTGRGEVYDLNLHLTGKPGQRTVGHSLVIGQTGSGKTVTTAFLISQSQKLNARVIVFDKDNGFEMAVRAMGGNYSSVRLGLPTHFNPLQAESDERGSAWLTDWLTAMVENDGPALTPVQVQALTDAVHANKTADKRLQNFSQLRGQLRSTDDDGDLYARLGRWDEEGQFGWLFGGKGSDPLNFDSRITAFDLTEVFDNDRVRTAWLSYVFRRIERQVEDENPTLIVLDEAWKLLDDAYFETRLKDWMLTMRKKNVAVALLTQRVSHIANSRAGSGILESAVTRLLFPSLYNTDEEMQPLALTETENEFLKTTNVDNHLALFKSGADSVILDMSLSSLGKGVNVLSGGRGEKAFDGWRDNPKFYLELMK